MSPPNPTANAVDPHAVLYVVCPTAAIKSATEILLQSVKGLRNPAYIDLETSYAGYREKMGLEAPARPEAGPTADTNPVVIDAYKTLLQAELPVTQCEYAQRIMEAVLIGQTMHATPEKQSTAPDFAERAAFTPEVLARHLGHDIYQHLLGGSDDADSLASLTRFAAEALVPRIAVIAERAQSQGTEAKGSGNSEPLPTGTEERLKQALDVISACLNASSNNDDSAGEAWGDMQRLVEGHPPVAICRSTKRFEEMEERVKRLEAALRAIERQADDHFEDSGRYPDAAFNVIGDIAREALAPTAQEGGA